MIFNFVYIVEAGRSVIAAKIITVCLIWIII